MGDNAATRAAQEGERGGAIVASQIDHAIEGACAHFAGNGEVADSAFEDESFVDTRNRWQQLFALRCESKRDVRLRESATQRDDRRSRQDQIAEPAELDEQDLQNKLISRHPERQSRDPAMNLKGSAAGFFDSASLGSE